MGLDAVLQYNIGAGRWIPADARVKPFVSYGNSLNYVNKLKETGNSPWGFSNQYGLGIQIKLARKTSLRIESALDQEIGKSFDTHMQHRLGFIQTIGRPKEETPPKKDSVPDYDQDGIADMDDHCPTIPGIVDKNGCPEDYVSAEEEQEFMDSLSNTIELILADMNKLKDSLEYMKQNPQVIVRYEKDPSGGTDGEFDPNKGKPGGKDPDKPGDSNGGQDSDNEGKNGEDPVYASVGRTDAEHPGIVIYDQPKTGNTGSKPTQVSKNPGERDGSNNSGNKDNNGSQDGKEGGTIDQDNPGIVIIPSPDGKSSKGSTGTQPKKTSSSANSPQNNNQTEGGSWVNDGKDYSYPPLRSEKSTSKDYRQNGDNKVEQGYYVIAISTLNKKFAERTAEVLRRTYPIVEIIPNENGFYRVGIYATRTRSEANKILKYTHEHGLPYAWISKQALVFN